MLLKHWDEQFNEGASNDAVEKLALLFTERIADVQTRAHLYNCVRGRRWGELCSFTPDYNRLSVADVIFSRQVAAFFSKNADLSVGVDKEAVTLAKLFAAERQCSEMNHKFSAWKKGRFTFPSWAESRFHEAAQLISRALGDVPNLTELHFRFGPGATTETRRANASHLAKCEEVPSCSEDLLPIVHHILAEMPGYVDAHSVELAEDRYLREVAYYLNMDADERDCMYGPSRVADSPPVAHVDINVCPSRLGFVPKNASSLRTTCTQPGLSMMFQLGIGDYLAGLLKRLGLDITDQTRNQRLAREGSLTGDLATLDLRSASDTISCGLVEHLLPMPWYEFLAYGRASYCEFPHKRIIRLSQFSSMGNGFTFPLQTLIFWALTCTCVPRHQRHLVSVYGDDIICPTSCVAAVRDLLTVAGFWLNEEKSFSAGPFRESCGADYMNGINVRPAYLKRFLSCMDLFVLHNYFRRNLDDEAADLCLTFIDPMVYLWGPDGYGDGHLLQPSPGWGGPSENRDPNTFDPTYVLPGHLKRGFSGRTFQTYTTKARRETRVYMGDFVFPLYEVYANGTPSAPLYEVVEGTKRVVQTVVGPDYVWTPRHTPETLFRASGVREVLPKGSGYDAEGRLVYDVPGWLGYKVIRIYILG
jgi:hypothetical protein